MPLLEEKLKSKEKVEKLSPTQLNSLIVADLIGFETARSKKLSFKKLSKQNNSSTIFLKNSYNQELSYAKITENLANTTPSTDIFITQIMKDSPSRESEPQLAYIGEVLPKLLEAIEMDSSDTSAQDFSEVTQKNKTILIPLCQCMNLFFGNKIGPKKAHYVLAKIDIEKEKKTTLTIHDSKPKTFFLNAYLDSYRDLIEKKFKFNFKYKNYSQQKDNDSCGYFVSLYIKKILDTDAGKDFSLENITYDSCFAKKYSDNSSLLIAEINIRTRPYCFSQRFIADLNQDSIEEENDFGAVVTTRSVPAIKHHISTGLPWNKEIRECFEGGPSVIKEKLLTLVSTLIPGIQQLVKKGSKDSNKDHEFLIKIQAFKERLEGMMDLDNNKSMKDMKYFLSEILCSHDSPYMKSSTEMKLLIPHKTEIKMLVKLMPMTTEEMELFDQSLGSLEAIEMTTIKLQQALPEAARLF